MSNVVVREKKRERELAKGFSPFAQRLLRHRRRAEKLAASLAFEPTLVRVDSATRAPVAGRTAAGFGPQPRASPGLAQG